MTISAKQIQIIHVAKAKLGLDDESYRTILGQVAGVTSSRDLKRAGFRAVMEYFAKLGFAPSGEPGHGFGERAAMASPKQVELIRALWREFKGEAADDFSLGRWLERSFHRSSVRFLGYDQAHKAIGALKKMKARRSTFKATDPARAEAGPPT